MVGNVQDNGRKMKEMWLSVAEAEREACSLCLDVAKVVQKFDGVCYARFHHSEISSQAGCAKKGDARLKTDNILEFQNVSLNKKGKYAQLSK